MARNNASTQKGVIQPITSFDSYGYAPAELDVLSHGEAGKNVFYADESRGLDPGLVEQYADSPKYEVALDVADCADSEFIFEPECFTGLKLRRIDLQNAINTYRSRQASFPFVVIPEDWTLNSMLERNTFLLLAVTAVTLSRDLSLQQALDKRLTEMLARKVVVEGERSIDLLQGLLVYLGWFHFFWMPRSQQLYGHVQIAVGMVIDLGLDQDLEDALAERSDLRLAKSEGDDSASLGGKSHEIEAQRAALGCFHLSSCISAGVTKPNQLRMNDYMLRVAQALELSPQYDTDRLINPLIRLDRIVEHARELYSEDKSDGGRTRLHTHAAHIMSNLEQWHDSLSLVTSELLQHAYQGTKIRILEMGLIYRFGPGLFYSELLKQKNWHQISIAQPGLIQNLSKCTDAAKAYMDSFLEKVSPVDYHALPLEEWLHLILAAFVLYRLCTGLREVPDWTPETARSTVDLRHYLKRVHERLQTYVGATRVLVPDEDDEAEIPGTRDLDGSITHGHDLFSLLPLVFANAHTSFMAIVNNGVSPDLIRAHQHLGGYGRTRSHKKQVPVRCPATTNLPRPPSSLPPANAAQTTANTVDAMMPSEPPDSGSNITSNEPGADNVDEYTQFWTDIWSMSSPLT